MSKIKNGGLDQYGAVPFEQQQFRTAGVEGVKPCCYGLTIGTHSEWVNTNLRPLAGFQGAASRKGRQDKKWKKEVELPPTNEVSLIVLTDRPLSPCLEFFCFHAAGLY